MEIAPLSQHMPISNDTLEAWLWRDNIFLDNFQCFMIITMWNIRGLNALYKIHIISSGYNIWNLTLFAYKKLSFPTPSSMFSSLLFFFSFNHVESYYPTSSRGGVVTLFPKEWYMFSMQVLVATHAIRIIVGCEDGMFDITNIYGPSNCALARVALWEAIKIYSPLIDGWSLVILMWCVSIETNFPLFRVAFSRGGKRRPIKNFVSPLTLENRHPLKTFSWYNNRSPLDSTWTRLNILYLSTMAKWGSNFWVKTSPSSFICDHCLIMLNITPPSPKTQSFFKLNTLLLVGHFAKEVVPLIWEFVIKRVINSQDRWWAGMRLCKDLFSNLGKIRAKERRRDFEAILDHRLTPL